MYVQTKGQIKSEWIYEIINFLCHFLEIDDFINSFWLNLTFRMQQKSSSFFQVLNKLYLEKLKNQVYIDSAL